MFYFITSEFLYKSICSSHFMVPYALICSAGIESVVNENKGKSSGILQDAMCNGCEMAVVWMQNQIRQNLTEENILEYVNKVN